MPKGPTKKEISKYLKGEMLPGSMVPVAFRPFVRDATSQSKKSSVLAPKKKYEKAIKAVKAVKVNVQDNRPKRK